METPIKVLCYELCIIFAHQACLILQQLQSILSELGSTAKVEQSKMPKLLIASASVSGDGRCILFVREQ